MPCKGLGEAALPAALGSLVTITLGDRGCSELQGTRWAQQWLGTQTENTPKASGLRDMGPVKTQQSFGEVLRVRAVVKCDFPGRGMSGCQFLRSPVVQ